MSVYLVVFGQALALQGPTGSVNKAIEILKRYQKHLLLTFSLTLLSLGCATIAGFWYVMSWYGASLCTVVAVIGMFSWHVHTVQIYNAMKFVPSDNSEFGERQETDMDFHDRDNPLLKDAPDVVAKRQASNAARSRAQSAHRASMAAAKASVGPASGPEESALASPFVSAWRAITRGGRKNAFPAVTATGNADVDGWASPAPNPSTDNLAGKLNPLNLATYSDRNFSNIIFDGSVDMRVVKQGGGNKWNGRYIVVTAHAMIMVYTAKDHYGCNGTAACCRQFRPIDISEYAFKVSDNGAGTNEKDSDIVTLSPLDNYMASIEIKCLDAKEFKKLMSVLSRISKPSA